MMKMEEIKNMMSSFSANVETEESWVEKICSGIQNEGYNIELIDADTEYQRLLNAFKSEKTISGYEKELLLSYADADADIQRAKRFFRNDPIEVNEVHLKDITIKPEGEFPALCHFQYTESEWLFENVIFENVILALGRNFASKWVFKNCTFKNCQYNSIRVTEWAKNLTLELEDCKFLNPRPDFDEYRADVKKLALTGWAYAPILVQGDVTLRINRCLFSNIMPEQVILFLSTNNCDKTPNGIRLELENTVFDTTNGACVSCGKNRAYSGYIKNCQFKNVGALRCNDEGYTQKEDYAIQSGIGTQESPYIYKCGIGGNAIFSVNGNPYRNDVVIQNNIISNVIENGIEGNYKTLKDNLIENSGYRLDSEGIWNPSMELIYGNNLIVDGNILKNPYKGYAGISLTAFETEELMIVQKNTIIYDKENEINKETAGIYFANVSTQEKIQPVIISDNIISGFESKYKLLNTAGQTYRDFNIYDKGISESRNLDNTRLIYQYFDKETKGIFINSDSSSQNMIKNYNLIDYTEQDLLSWEPFYSDISLNTDGSRIFTRIVSNNNLYCGGISQYNRLPQEICACAVEIVARSSSSKIAVSLKSVDNFGHTISNQNGNLSGNTYQTFECSPEEFVTIKTTLFGCCNTRLCILNPETQINSTDFSVLDIVSIKLRFIRNEKIVMQNDNIVEVEKDEGGNYIIHHYESDVPNYPTENSASVYFLLPGDTEQREAVFSTAVWYMKKYTGNGLGSGKIILKGDTGVTEPIFTIGGEFEFDLAGYRLYAASETLSGVLFIQNASIVDLIDSVGTGSIENFKNYAVVVGASGILNIKSGSYNGANYALQLQQSKNGDMSKCVITNGIFGDGYGMGVQTFKESELVLDIDDGNNRISINGIDVNGKVTISEHTSATIGGSAITSIQKACSLFYSTEILSCIYQNAGTEYIVEGDSSQVLYYYEVEENGKYVLVEKSATLTDALRNLRNLTSAQHRGIIRLQKNIYTYAGFPASSGYITLDLNGYTISSDYQYYTFIVNGNCNFEIMDSSESQSGIVENSLFNAVTVSSSNAIFTLSGGTLKTRARTAALRGQSGSAINISGGRIDGSVGVTLEGINNSSVNIRGGVIDGSFGNKVALQIPTGNNCIISGGDIGLNSETGLYALADSKVTFRGIENIVATIKKISSAAMIMIDPNTSVTVDGTEINNVINTSGVVRITYK